MRPTDEDLARMESYFDPSEPELEDRPLHQDPWYDPDSWLEDAYEDRFTLEEGLAEWEEWR